MVRTLILYRAIEYSIYLYPASSAAHDQYTFDAPGHANRSVSSLLLALLATQKPVQLFYHDLKLKQVEGLWQTDIVFDI